MLGDIGGQLGLWIGISVLTLAEFAQLLIELIKLGCVSNKKFTNKVESGSHQQLSSVGHGNSNGPPPHYSQYQEAPSFKD